MDADSPDELPDHSLNYVVVGRISSVFGVKGWLKVHSHTDPLKNITEYPFLFIKQERAQEQDWQVVKFDQWQAHGKGLIAHIDGCDDRDKAGNYTGMEISIPEAELPRLEQGEYYWRQLIGLKVSSQFEGEQAFLGRVYELLETGANDVLVVRACEGSVDKGERLIPYLPESVVLEVDLAAGIIMVNWDPDF